MTAKLLQNWIEVSQGDTYKDFIKPSHASVYNYLVLRYTMQLSNADTIAVTAVEICQHTGISIIRKQTVTDALKQLRGMGLINYEDTPHNRHGVYKISFYLNVIRCTKQENIEPTSTFNVEVEYQQKDFDKSTSTNNVEVKKEIEPTTTNNVEVEPENPQVQHIYKESNDLLANSKEDFNSKLVSGKEGVGEKPKPNVEENIEKFRFDMSEYKNYTYTKNLLKSDIEYFDQAIDLLIATRPQLFVSNPPNRTYVNTCIQDLIKTIKTQNTHGTSSKIQQPKINGRFTQNRFASTEINRVVRKPQP